MGYGDDLMATAQAWKAKKRYPKHKILIGDGHREHLSPVFWHNPSIDHVVFTTPGDKIIWIKNYPGHRPYFDPKKSDRLRHWFTNFKCSPGKIYLTPTELDKAQKELRGLKRFILIEPHVSRDTKAPNKDWGFDRWQNVVDSLRQRWHFIQVGDQNAESLKNVRRIFTSDFRSACAVLSFARLFVGPESGLHHAAGALRIPGVVLFGGRVSPRTTGYDFHKNLYIRLKESPCGRLRYCHHCQECLQRISVDRVISAIKTMMQKPKKNIQRR